MNLGFRQIFTVFATLFFAINVPAQEIPVLPGDPAVLNGVTPNGMAYYIVANPAEKGKADFALVRKVGKLTSHGQPSMDAVSAAREALVSLRRVNPSTAAEFMSRHEAVPEKDGFVKVTDDATVFRFPGVRLTGGANVADSALLVLMDIADRPGNSPADQAVVVSGDVDPKSLASKLVSMSYMVPAAKPAARKEYRSEDRENAVFMRTLPAKPGLSEICATWTSKRVPREYMNTVQPEIFEMSLNTLGAAAVMRIRKTLRSAGIPVADVSYSHICSSSYPYDDSFSVNVTVGENDAAGALEAVAEAMASIDAAGVGTDEYLVSESAYVLELAENVSKPVKSNSEYVDRCVNAFLYNSSLASPKERFAFHNSRNLPDTMRVRLFNDIAKALLDGARNLTVRSTLDTSSARSAFDSVWTAYSAVPKSFAISADTLGLPGAGVKVKLKSSKKEPVSGGSIWTFSNGFKVIYRKMSSDRMHYALALNGGYADQDALDSGEGAFLADYPGLCRIGGMRADEFMDGLMKDGVTMEVDVNMSNTIVSGSLPEGRMQLLLRSLLAVANEMESDADAVDYYRKSEYLAIEKAQGSLYARMTAIDSIMCPGYRYSPYKQPDRISPDFLSKADRFFDERFSRMNDGALIIVGNMDEDKLKKLLMQYVGGFRTEDSVLRRPILRYQPVSGWSTYTVDGVEDNVDVAVSIRLPLTMDNYMAANMASMLLKRSLSWKLDGSGMHISLSHNCRIYPEERLNLLISLSEVSEEGFASDMKKKTPIEALADVRSVLSGLDRIMISEADLKPYKETLKNRISMEMKSPDYWLHAIALRYLDGKDLSTNYASRIDALTPEKVMSILTLLDEGSKVEYVTSKK